MVGATHWPTRRRESGQSLGWQGGGGISLERGYRSLDPPLEPCTGGAAGGQLTRLNGCQERAENCGRLLSLPWGHGTSVLRSGLTDQHRKVRALKHVAGNPILH